MKEKTAKQALRERPVQPEVRTAIQKIWQWCKNVIMWRGYVYRFVMRIAHKFNWHYAPPIYPDGDTHLWCKWCGFRQTVKRIAQKCSAKGEKMVKYEKDEIFQMSVEELKDAKLILETSIADIKMQIDDAKIDEKEYGIKPDMEWLKKANSAKRATSNRLLMINYRLSKLKMEKHKTFERAFVDTAKEELDDATFGRLLELTQLKIEGK